MSRTRFHVLSRVFIIGIIAILLCSFGVIYSHGEETERTVILDGISINGIDVSGMTKEEAISAISSEVEKYSDAEITLKADDNTLVCKGSDLQVDIESEAVVEKAFYYGETGNIIERFEANQNLKNGGTKDFTITPSVSNAVISTYLQDHMSELEKEPVNYGLTRVDGEFQLIEGESGYTINVDDAADEIVNYVSKNWDGSDCKIALTTTVVEPEGSAEELQAVTDKMGTYSTDYSTSASGRKTNVANGASKINGTVLYPGEQISIAEKLNPITEANGYAMAGAYENGQTVEAVGGGVCQISSTIYNAVIRAELQIDERYPHSMTVHYVDPSADAAIAGDYKDLKFTNNTEYPIYLELITNGSTITCNVYGKDTREAGRTVDFVSEIVEQTDPLTVYTADSTQPIGYMAKTTSAYTGYVAKLIKIVYMNGVEQSREEFNHSTYKKVDAVYSVGIASANAEASGAVNSAVASQDLATIQSAIAQWNDAAQAQAAAEAQAQAQAAEQAKKAEEESEKEDSDSDSKKSSESSESSESSSDSSSDSE
ncbi:MAG: VanW family protein [Lachnospiraceae bacterium]|nr:VanW family protein [Lachnospiraceae bacterium]